MSLVVNELALYTFLSVHFVSRLLAEISNHQVFEMHYFLSVNQSISLFVQKYNTDTGQNTICLTLLERHVTSPTSPAATPHHSAKLPSPPLPNSCGRIQVGVFFAPNLPITELTPNFFRAGVLCRGCFAPRGVERVSTLDRTPRENATFANRCL